MTKQLRSVYRIGKVNFSTSISMLQAGRSGDQIPVGARFSAPVQTSPGAHPASCTMDTGSLPGVKSGRGMTLTPHPLLVLWSKKSRAIPLHPSPPSSLHGQYGLYRDSVPVQGCTLLLPVCW